MSDKPITDRQAELNARRDEDIAAHQAAVDAQAVEAVEFVDAGYDETLPGQEEVEAGSVEHVQLLNSYGNATSYAPTHNVVVPPPPEEPPPPEGGVTRGGEYADQQR